MASRNDIKGLVALCGAVGVLAVFAIMDFYAVHSCFGLFKSGNEAPDLCTGEHLFRSALEIAGLAIGLYGVAKVVT